MRSKALHIISILLLTVGMATTAQGQSKIKIHGDVYGGGDQAAVQGNTNVTINKGEYGGSIYGGGNGALYTADDETADPLHKAGTVKSSADIGTHKDDGTLEEDTGDTHVTINGGEIVYSIGDENNLRNIYGGGNAACNVAGSTNIEMTKGMITTWSFLSSDHAMAAWRHFYDNSMKPNQQKIPICSVFGAGYGAHTDVAGNTNVNVNIPGTAGIKPADGIAFTHAELEAIDKLALRLKPNTILSEQFVPAVHGGGFDGTVGAYDKDSYDKDNTDPTHAINYAKTTYDSQTNITIQGQPFVFNVFGGGLGSKSGADATGGVNSYVGAVYGATKVDIQGGLYNGNVFGGGAGIESEQDIPNPFGGSGTVKLPYTYAAQVMRETDVTISGNTTIIYGNVYGGGDIANTGWYYESARPKLDGHQAQQNQSEATLDFTTSLKLNGGNILGSAFGGGNGRTKAQMTMSMFVGTVCGSTNVSLNGTKVWSHVYGGGNMGTVFTCQTIAASKGESGRTMVNGVIDGCTNVAILNGMVAKDIFGGGYGDNPGTGDANVTSADIYGNTYVYFENADLEYSKYWKPREFLPEDATNEQMMAEVTGRFLDQSSAGDKRNTESDITHNLYGGGNMACDVKGNTHVYMTGAPIAPADFSTTDYYKECIANVAKPHFSVFGGGFGDKAMVTGSAYSDVNLRYGTGLHSIVGGGLNGTVGGMCNVHVGNDPMSLVHFVYGGGYYAPCAGTELDITRGTILENVYGGAVMGNIHASGLSTDVATNTTIGLKSEGANSSVVLKDEFDNTLRSYTYDDNKNLIAIHGDVYGGNDVSGTVNGIAQLTIYGGEIKGNVYGAGNGNHIGYYIPDALKYDLGTHGSDNYFMVDHSGKGGPKGKTYVGRPQTIGGVNLTLEGNTKDERVKVLGQVFGGGNSCTIGAWDKNLLASKGDDPHVVRDDPAYFQGGGTLDINLGSHVTIGRTHEQLAKDADGGTYIDNGENVSGLFMGCSGRDLATQNGAYTEDNYYHHFFDYKAKQYYPGFAVGTEAGASMTREEQLKPFQAYLNNIMVWSDSVRLNIPDDAEDIWLANFVGGGFRGSMRTKEITGKFDYTLPEGVTVSHTIVGGAYNAHVQYHYYATDGDGKFVDAGDDGVYDYATTIPAGWAEGTDYVRLEYEDEENPDPAHIKSIIRYNFNGGMLSENSTGLSSSDVGHHVHQVHADPRANEAEYATAYFEPMTAGSTGEESKETKAKLYSANKNKALLHLTLKCALEPEVLPKNDGSGKNYAHGGNVFGGCFMSGFVEGDSWVDYHCWLAPKCAQSTEDKYKYFFDKNDNMHIYDDAGDLETNNALSVYGAGYGSDTHSDGDVYLYIKSIAHQALGDTDPAGMFPYIYNAFGGSNMGTVSGNTNVYYAVGKQGTLLGSLYGGGYKGVIEGNTFVEMAEGFAHNVYGGSRQADIHGASHVWAYDGKARGITDANHLIICNLYGGNDIAGTISGTMPATFTATKWNKAPTGDGTSRPSLTGKKVNTYVEISADDNSADRGFPLVGSAFAGGNGAEWKEGSGDKPNVATALLEIEGGSTLRAFGGGNMATVTDSTYIFTNAVKHNFANVTFSNYQKNIVTKVFFSGMKSGFRWDENTLTIDPYHVVRLFGGNNLATMDIQPTWNLWKGKLGNVYSGGNMGDMTYYNPEGKPSTQKGAIGETAGVENNSDGSNANYNPRGLSITVDSPDIYINSLFGGCRVSDVRPDDSNAAEKWPTGTDGEDFYGATVNITDGYIENVYGGNDVSGSVAHGTNVNISGAVSGNVYGSGNGYYLYKYDDEATAITEEIDDEFGIHYIVPEKKSNGALYDLRGKLGTETHKLLTINEFRPSVEKAFLNIGGVESYKDPKTGVTGKRVAYVKGNVFCGGNASTLTNDGVNSFTKFKIGSYVTLNGVFMGCDGYDYTQDKHISDFAKINGIKSMGDATDFKAGYEADAQHNPILLNAYMMAVDMLAQPKDFNLNLPLKEAHIGTYCGGGNRGSMLVDKTVTLPFHHDIIIYDKIVAGCLDANVRYNENGTYIVSQGGYTRPIANRESTGNNTKFKLDIASQFVPLVMDVPDNKDPETKNSHGETFEEAKAHDFLYDNRQKGVKYTFEEFNDLFQPDPLYTSQVEFEEKEGLDHQWKIADGIYAPKCNVYGGCYQSGEIEGDVELNIHSNMLRYVNKEDLDKSLANNIACFNVYGAGFGQDSHVWGDVKITLDRSLDPSTMGTIGGSTVSDELAERLGAPHGTHASADVAKWNLMHNTNKSDNILGIANANTYPSANNIIGGGRNGKLIGNSTLEIRNGLVYSDVAGGCYASDMYGSTHVIVGYPTYYICNASGKYSLDRADKWNTTKKDADGNDVIKQSVWYLKGDLVPENVYQQIVAADDSKTGNFDLQTVSPTTYHSTDGTTWNDVVIKIGKGIYGGGYSLANSAAASAGSVTTHKLANSQGTDLYVHNFDRHEAYRHYGVSTIGYGGNSSIMVGDQKDGTVDHVTISTLNVAEATIPAGSSVIGKFIKESDGRYTHQGDHQAVPGTKYYTLTGEGGIYGDGHLTFCDGFRAADVTRYGWAEATAQHPKLLNTFQRMDLLSVNDCCLMLQGAQDFATDQIDATTYSITRVNELRLNSTLDATQKLGEISAQNDEGGIGQNFNDVKQRNYLAFFNNVHYLGSIVTNDKFDATEHTFHGADGTLALGTQSYKKVKQDFISAYTSSAKDADAVNAFKQRNVATARNAIGINNGYCLRVQNQEYVGTGDAKHADTYYGPIVGVCEVKLLTLVEGEGGGYVYADNIHADENNFLMTSGNFVFPGIVHGDDQSIGAQYIVDDCFIDHFGTSDDITTKHGDLDEAHYWYVEGNKYFFTTTLTGFTYQTNIDFNLIDNDPNIILSGMENGSKLNIKKIEWLSQHRAKYESVLMNDEDPEKVSDYEFDIEIGNSNPKNPETDWVNHMPRHNAGSGDAAANYYTHDKTVKNTNLPQFNVRLQDKLDNSGDLAYDNHLDEPELVKIYLEGKRKVDGVEQTYEYTITLNIVYLQGPTFEGGVLIENCALPGELIRFSTEGLKIKTPDLMPITSATWQIVPLSEITADGEWKWDTSKGIVIPEDRYEEKTDGSGNITGTIPAIYKQNEYNIAYIFTAGGHDFPVMPAQKVKYAGLSDYNNTNSTSISIEDYNALTEDQKIKSIPAKENRMIVVHNYHRMKDVVSQNLQIETMPKAIDKSSAETYHTNAEAKIYIEDEADLRAFVEYLNMATESNTYNIPVGLTGLDIILQKDITLNEKLPTITQAFAGNFHGDGYCINLNGKQTTLFGNMLSDTESNKGRVYNLGLIAAKDATIASTGNVTNSYVSGDVDANALAYGRKAYELSHYFTETNDATDRDNYVHNYYANGDYQYATTDRVWSLRTGAPNYGHEATRHDTVHTHDAARWIETDGINKPLYDGAVTVADHTVDVSGNGTEYFTYRGLPVGYANDYLFFGQHLDKVNADNYPVHIEPVANGDGDDAKGGNRVFKAAGYYQSKEDQQFFYNKDAWALYRDLTAIDFTQATEGDEGDGASTVPTMFSVDSNNDGGTYSNETTGRITQNLLVYNSGESVFDEKDVKDIAESAVVYHNIVKSAGVFSTDYLHLVDKQDFNAPIAFNVNTRAWYERMPQTYRNLVSGNYNSSSAWEGICLPFTATKVTAEKNGEISHFYGETEGGDHTLHHEYWLTGFTALEDDKATFARPSVSGTGLFVNGKQTAAKFDYTYGANSYFTSLYSYNDHYDSRDDEGDDTMDSHDNAWYAKSHTFKDYVPLTAAVPYIVAFPGNDFYEFSMESYYKEGEYGCETYPQMATFESGATTIKVTDDDVETTTVGTHNHKGTFLHVSGQYGINDDGTAFESAQNILPFRTYMSVKSSSAKPQRILIYDGMNTDDEEGLGLFTGDRLKIYTEGNAIVVESNYDTTLKLYTVSGIYVRTLQVSEGVNKFNNIPSGLYIIGDKKVKI